MKKRLLLILTSVMTLVLTGCSLGGPDVSDIELNKKEFMKIMEKEDMTVEEIKNHYGTLALIYNLENTVIDAFRMKENGYQSAGYVETDSVEEAANIYRSFSELCNLNELSPTMKIISEEEEYNQSQGYYILKSENEFNGEKLITISMEIWADNKIIFVNVSDK